MAKTVQDVKFAVPTILDKLSGNNQESFTKGEFETLVFSFQSNILFDSVAQKFLPSLQAIPDVSELILTGEETERELQDKDEEHSALVKERDDNIKAVLLAVIKEHILRDMRTRFGA
ncbi:MULTISPECIES: hypothetical protein [unclassified Paenibacillus]|uniref:hypothetical protein n=1 Tax=unclassified Paenibacillus TaxID=185978 RepID=UPI00089D7893|nr:MULTISPECIES: hypothetical protein [unclassified Paenibacillus]OMC68638.1 hypothetical protein BK126_12480 [Paenibacillus sp. FSL H7-0326]SDW56558.1 hypothetical protein SAMN05518848_102197 [Paenibacillus sp. PDC88]